MFFAHSGVEPTIVSEPIAEVSATPCPGECLAGFALNKDGDCEACVPADSCPPLCKNGKWEQLRLAFDAVAPDFADSIVIAGYNDDGNGPVASVQVADVDAVAAPISDGPTWKVRSEIGDVSTWLAELGGLLFFLAVVTKKLFSSSAQAFMK